MGVIKAIPNPAGMLIDYCNCKVFNYYVLLIIDLKWQFEVK